MALVTAVALRNAARSAMLSAGGRGFMRFVDQGGLLVCDALRRCTDDVQRSRLLDTLAAAGFACCEQDGLLYLTPGDALLAQIDCVHACSVDWNAPQCSVQALACRWLSKGRAALTDAGRQLIVDSLRLTWQDRAQDGLAALRAQAAVMQRSGDISGFYEAGAVLANWCDMQEGKKDED
ncbi:MAG: hypothetical protein IKJ11_03005 [Clostridia bacterium]|nr:hypothetical protein [Clostridia bacterium]